MYYLKCKIKEIKPSYVIAETNNVGYKINLFAPPSTREDEEILIYILQEFKIGLKNQINSYLYGCLSKKEYELFNFFISIKGIGFKTAQIMLSNNWGELSTLIVQKDRLSLSKLKGFNLSLANSLLYAVSQSKIVRNIFLSLSEESKEDSPDTSSHWKNNWNEEEVINSLVAIGYEWDSIKKALDELRIEKIHYTDTNAVINKCLQTIAQTQSI